jgi:uncharacterized membrane protein YgcG
MQDKMHMLMIIFGLAVALIYMMGWAGSKKKCEQEGFAGQTEKPTKPGCYLYTKDCARIPAGPNRDGPYLDVNNWFLFPGNQFDTEEKCKSTIMNQDFKQGMQRDGCTISDDNYLFVPQNSSTTPATETTTPDSGLDNYSHFSKNSIPTVYYGPDSSTARVTVAGGENDETGADKQYGITVTAANGATKTYVMDTGSNDTAVVNPLTNTPDTPAVNPLTNTPESAPAPQATVVPESIANTRFVDKNGNIAKLYVAENGQYVVQTRQINGYDMVYTSTNVFTYDRNKSKSFMVGDSVNDITPISEAQNTTNDLIGSLTNNTISSRQTQTTNGIPGRSIPIGQEDLYILKSQIVPPVCPACPQICAGKNSKEKCAPCPSCARCPESTDFTCKKIPNYSSNTTSSTISGGSMSGGSMSGGSMSGGSMSGGDSMWGPGSSSSISSSNGANGSASTYNQYRNNSKFSPVPVVSNFSMFGM